jgi:hypothetical protein
MCIQDNFSTKSTRTVEKEIEEGSRDVEQWQNIN